MTKWTEYVQTAEGAEILGVAQWLSLVKRSDLKKFLKGATTPVVSPAHRNSVR